MGRLALKQILREKAEQIAQGTAVLVKKTNDWQQIKRYMTNRLGEIKLTASQQSKLDRYQFIYNQLVSGKYSEADVISSVMNLYNLELRQVYDDMQCTRELFGEVLAIDKRFELKVELETARAAQRQCIAVNDFKNASSYKKIIVTILALLREEETSPGEMFEGHQITPVFDPSLIGAPAISKEDFTDLMKRIAEKRGKQFDVSDIPFEDIK